MGVDIGTVASLDEGVRWAATQLAAEVFRTLKSMAEARFRLPAEKAVVTLPTAADRSAQDAVVEAARLAGIEVVQTVP